MFRRINVIPEELRELLPTTKRAVVVIGNNAYEMYPIPIMQLPEILNEVLNIYENARKYVKSQYEKDFQENFDKLLKELNTIRALLATLLQQKDIDVSKIEEIKQNIDAVVTGLMTLITMMTTVRPLDIIGAPGNKELIIPLLDKLFVGVPREDYEQLTPQQLIYIITKAFEINSTNLLQVEEEVQQNIQQQKGESFRKRS